MKPKAAALNSIDSDSPARNQLRRAGEVFFTSFRKICVWPERKLAEADGMVGGEVLRLKMTTVNTLRSGDETFLSERRWSQSAKFQLPSRQV